MGCSASGNIPSFSSMIVPPNVLTKAFNFLFSSIKRAARGEFGCWARKGKRKKGKKGKRKKRKKRKKEKGKRKKEKGNGNLAKLR